jgi:hypothetical protein
MSARFRIRTPQGQELSFASEEMFADFVRSGDLSEGDLVYDASTGEWSPALTHTLVLDLQSGQQEDSGALESEGAAGGEDIGFQLAPEQSPEEASAAFVREMEAERAAEFERRQDLRGLQSDESGSGLLREIQRTASKTPPVESGADDIAAPASEPTPPKRKTPPRRSRRTRDAGTRRSVSGAFLGWTLALLVVGLGALLGPDLVALAMGSAGAAEEGVTAAGPVLPDTEEALAARADARFLGTVRGRIVSLPSIPSEWLTGRYLANASEYPRIGEVWTGYLVRIREVRAREAELYSAAYLSALDDARVSGANRTLRLASAMSRFERESGERTEHYARVEELALAATGLHDLLMEREDRITYEPAVGSRVSVDPILQAAGADPETQALLDAALDRVLDALSARGEGPVEAAALPGWVFDGLRDAVAPE